MDAVLGILGAIEQCIDRHESAITAVATIAIAAFTGTLWWSTRRLWQETEKASVTANKTAEAALNIAQAVQAAGRAYVKMSHLLPGLVFSNPPGICSIQMKVHNTGDTPARVTDLVVSRLIQPSTSNLPAIPEYKTGKERVEYFLYKDDPFHFIRHFQLADSDREDMQNGRANFYLWGYVDYIDQFGIRHRSGYGRQFDPHGNPDNLKFITQPSYNYDRLRQQGEGRDWVEELN